MWLHYRRTGTLETLAYNLAITNESYIIVGILCLCIQGQLRCIVICFTTTQHNIIYNYGSVLVLHTTVWYECQIKQFTLVTGNAVIAERECDESVCILVNLCNRARMPGQALGNFQIIVGGCHSRHEMYIHLHGNYTRVIIKPNAHYIITVLQVLAFKCQIIRFIYGSRKFNCLQFLVRVVTVYVHSCRMFTLGSWCKFHIQDTRSSRFNCKRKFISNPIAS